MYGYIYKITNNINNKIYVGKHKSEKFDDSYWGGGKILRKSIKKYGKENFSREILEECFSKKELNEKEKFWIKELDCRNPEIGYNISIGGDGGGIFGHHNFSEQGLNAIKTANSCKHSKEHNQKISESLSKKFKGRKKSPEWVEKIVQSRKENGTYIPWNKDKKGLQTPWNKGLTKDTDERVKQNIISRTKTVNEQGTFKGENNPFYGKHHSEETKQKISNSKKGSTPPNKGKRWITNGDINKYINEDEFEIYASLGFRFGITRNVSK